MTKDYGGSREPSSDGLGPSGFDPSRYTGWVNPRLGWIYDLIYTESEKEPRSSERLCAAMRDIEIADQQIEQRRKDEISCRCD